MGDIFRFVKFIIQIMKLTCININGSWLIILYLLEIHINQSGKDDLYRKDGEAEKFEHI